MERLVQKFRPTVSAKRRAQKTRRRRAAPSRVPAEQRGQRFKPRAARRGGEEARGEEAREGEGEGEGEGEERGEEF